MEFLWEVLLWLNFFVETKTKKNHHKVKFGHPIAKSWRKKFIGFVGPLNTLQYVQKIRQLDTPLKDNKASIKSLGCNQKLYLPRKVIVCLFVLFGRPVEISQTTAPLVTFLISLKSPWWVRGAPSWFGFIMLHSMVEK